MEHLPRPAPADPLPLAAAWLNDADARVAKNPRAMALASVAADGRPSVRYVLLKTLSLTGGHAGFYTNYRSRKAAELDAGGFAAGVLYWPESGRQLRLEGTVQHAPAGESDAYFGKRPRLSQLNAWASDQSQRIATPEAMAARLAERETEFAGTNPIPRPPHWGGYRLTLAALEFWIEGSDRFHERLRYERQAETWSSNWLQP